MDTYTIVVLFAVLSYGSTFPFASLSEDQCSDPNQVNSPICNLIPAACLRPVCAEDNSPDSSNNDEVWFRSICHLVMYNIRCRGKYRIMSESECPMDSAPLPSSGICPIQIPSNFMPFTLK